MVMKILKIRIPVRTWEADETGVLHPRVLPNPSLSRVTDILNRLNYQLNVRLYEIGIDIYSSFKDEAIPDSFLLVFPIPKNLENYFADYWKGECIIEEKDFLVLTDKLKGAN